MINIKKLARDFCDDLRDEIGGDNVEEVNRLNSSETSPGVCHSHDFCDANMVIFGALCKQVTEDEALSDVGLSAMNEAWDMARNAEFNPLQIRD